MRIILLVTLSIIMSRVKAQSSFNMNLLYQWKDSTLVQSIINTTYNEVWGYAKNGREYAIIGSTEGTHIFDITDVNNVTAVSFIPGKFQGSQVIHRDFDTYKNYLYIVGDEGTGSLQIADLSFLPDSTHLVYDSDSLIIRAHNIFIDTTSGHLYACGGVSNLGNDSLSIYSLQADPTNPQFLLNCSNDVPFWSSTIGYVHDIYVRHDTAYCNAGNNGLFIVDFTDLSNVQLIGSLTSYTQQGYNHSGWLHASGNYYAFADENSGLDVKIVDVTDLSNITLIDTVGSNVNQRKSMPHNPIFKGNLLYVSFYQDGIYVFNTSDLNNISLAGYYDTSTLPYIFSGGNWGVYPFLPSGKILVSDMQNGLFVLDTSFPIGIEETKMNDNFNFIAYPNPATNNITITTSSFKNILAYSIIDISGKIVKRGKLSKSQTNISLNKFANGFYTISIQHNGNRVTKQFIKR